MATSSISNVVHQKDKPRIQKLVRALEQSQAASPNDVHLKQPVSDFSADQIRKVFGGKAPENAGCFVDANSTSSV